VRGALLALICAMDKELASVQAVPENREDARGVLTRAYRAIWP
jgi:hypothetical protein